MTGSSFSPPPPQVGGSERCRQCGARLADGVGWCSLCLTPTTGPRPKPQAAEEPVEKPVEKPVVRGRHVGPDSEKLLAGLAAVESHSGGRSALTVARAHLALAEIPGGKYAVALGGGLLLLILLMGGLTVLGLLV